MRVPGRTHKARVVAHGNHVFKALVTVAYPAAQQRPPLKLGLDGKRDGDRVAFKHGSWSGVYAAGKIAGTIGSNGVFEMTRYVPKSPTEGRKPPEGAIVLLDGKSFEQMQRGRTKDGKQSEWQVDEADGSVLIPRRGMRSKASVEGSFDLHVEFLVPFRPDKRSQGRGNSGVYLPCRTEIQVLDSFGMTTYTGGGCGGLYRWKDPDTFEGFNLSSYPPMVWQTYDVEYRVRTDGGKPAGFLTVHHNGVKIHDSVRLKRPPRKGGFSFQDHGNPLRYRNIWVLAVRGT